MRQPADTADPVVTLEEFERLPEENDYKVELVRGRLVREPRPLPRHGQLVVRLGSWLHAHVEEHGLGFVTADSGFVIQADPPTVRGPDVAFLAGLSTEDLLRRGFLPGGPAIAVEIVSPSNSAADVQEKVLEYLGAGTRIVWVVDPRTRTVTDYRSRDEIRVLTEDDDLDGGDVLPGFRASVRRLFALP